MANSPSSPAEYLREALEKSFNYDPDASVTLVNYCERADPQDASEYIHNAIQGDVDKVIEEYLHRRSLGELSFKKNYSLGEPVQIYKKPDVHLSTPKPTQIYKKPEVSLSSLKPMQIYKKPEVSLSTPTTVKNRKKLTPGTQATINASVQSKHNQRGVSGHARNPEKEHSEEILATVTNHKKIRAREKCDCQAREHKLVNNCLACGKIVCEKEGEGPCMFCGKSEVWCHESPSKHLRGHAEGNSEAEDRAITLKNKLLEQDRRGNLQTTVIDDQSDMFNIEGNTWMTPEEKEKRISLEEAESARKSRTVLRLGADVGEVDFSTEDDIQNSDPANNEVMQTIVMKANPNIRECPIYVAPEITEKRVERRIPENMKVSSGRVQHDEPLFQIPNFHPRDVFDICVPETDAACQGDEIVELAPSLHAQTKINKELTEMHNEVQILMPGMIWLKHWLSKDDQVKIVKTCQELGVGKAGFYQPGYGNQSKMHLWMMCLGKNWNPESRSYEDIRSYDNAKPPSIPSYFTPLVRNAIQAAHNALIQNNKLIQKDVRTVLPCMDPDVCIVNFYKESGSLGLHQDRDESSKSLEQGLPVVSFSIGDAAEFLYGTERDPSNAKKIVLESGDVLIFGGLSRHVFHGISRVKPNTSAKWLIRDSRLRPGRVNLTFRQI
ncbi:hypothetical protein KI387_023350 [Taxus chinensis]|uniref:Fe2OG dioxygenase domain-containing protein n=1 Tax=Taxus chinensis TaxID=29808 RepID=A0AA38G4Q0_TAXCH|nr:hypothetical protein KI387_023350 [Taxus chinensis]